MKTFLFFPLAAGLLCAADYSADDRSKALSLMDDSRRILVVTVSGMSVAQSNFKPDSKTWSVTEVIEHLALAEEFLFSFLKQAIDKGPSIPDDQKLPDPSEGDKAILTRVPDRSQKATAPEPAVPKGKYPNWEEALHGFSAERGKTVEFIQKQKQDLRRYQIESPMGKVDGHQWLLIIGAHTERHVKQIQELMKHELFPKN